MAPGTLQLSVGTPAELTLGAPCSRGTAAWVGCGHLDDVLLVFSELVTNAVIHAGGTESVHVRLDEAAVMVVVEDASALGPQMRPGGDASGGFGPRIVDQLAAEWGWEQTGTGKQVWAKVRCFD
jgi:anti-sigma regulatory factor (Ser/Thr protein kinase)